MKEISEKISFLQGLNEGLGLSSNSGEGKILAGILNVLDEVAESLDNMQEELDSLYEYMDSIDQDLFELQASLGEDSDKESFVELTCSHCGEKVCFEVDLLDDEDVIEIVCPECNEIIYINEDFMDYDPARIKPEFTAEQPS